MELLFLGTGAADWQIEKRDERKEFRRLSSALINDDLLIDPGPHIFDYAEKSGSEHLFDNVKYILVTHPHGDHFNADTVKKIKDVCRDAVLIGDKTLKNRIIEKYPEMAGMTVVTPDMTETLTLNEYEVVTLPANHTSFADDMTRHYYIVEKKSGKKLFYGVDSGWLTSVEWNFLKRKRCDAMVFELTIGDAWGDDRIFSHTSIPMLRIMLDTVRHQMAVEDGGKIYTTHMARTLHHDHATLTEQLRPMNVTPAYDGMRIVVD